MACTRFEYVKKFELNDAVLPSTFMVVRIDGRGFTKFTDLHKFEKPNDDNGLKVMNVAAEFVVEKFPDIILAYGQSDEYSFAFKEDSELFERRREKIVSTVVSMFTACYVHNFTKITGRELLELPTFDGRLVCYPSYKILADYFSWRQADCHINNLYNYCFWTLVIKGKMDRKAAEKKLSGTLSDQKNEILFKEYDINYAKTPAAGRKGTVIKRVWRADEQKMKKYLEEKEKDPTKKLSKPREKQSILQTNEDIIGEEFWQELTSELTED